MQANLFLKDKTMNRRWVIVFPLLFAIWVVLIFVITPLDVIMGIDYELPGYSWHSLIIAFCGFGIFYLRAWLWESYGWFRDLQDIHVNLSIAVLSILLPFIISLILNSIGISFSGPVWYVTLAHYIIKFLFGYFIALGKEWYIDTYKPHWR